MPKRKQILPRRTRREPSLNPADNEESGAKNNTEAFQSDVNENSKISIKNVEDTCTSKTEKSSPNERKGINHRNMVNSKGDIHTKNGSLSQSKSLEKKSYESLIENDTKQLRQLGYPPENFNVLPRNLERPLDNFTLSVDNSKTPTPFLNYRNKSEDGNMPVILNVFTLSKVPATHSKQKTTGVLRENSFPVTPPSSPPLLKLKKVRTQFPPNNGFTKTALNEPTMESNVSNNFIPVKRQRQNGIKGVYHAVFPSTPSRFKDERNCTVQNQVGQSSGKLQPENEQFLRLSDEVRGRFSEENRSPYQSRLRQLLQRNHILQNEISNMNHDLKDIEQTTLNILPANPMSQAIVNGNLESESRENKLEHLQLFAVLPETGKLSSTKSQFASDHENSVNDNDVFLSPRDVKVLQLKRKLKEQEEVLKNLRKSH